MQVYWESNPTAEGLPPSGFVQTVFSTAAHKYKYDIAPHHYLGMGGFGTVER
jgi:hypothetical protein